MTMTRRRLPEPTDTAPAPPSQIVDELHLDDADDRAEELDVDEYVDDGEVDDVEENTPESDCEGDPADEDLADEDLADEDLAERGVAETYQAEFIGARTGRNGDPFGSTLLLTAADQAIRVWAPLTPTTITALVDQLTGILRTQKAALGILTDTGIDSDVDDGSVVAGMSPAQLKTVIQLHEADRSVAELAELSGTSPAAIRRVLAEAGVPAERPSLRERVSDPMGLRGLRERSSRTPIVIACAILGLLLLAFVGKLFLQ